jgi:hypothetical protein
MVIERILMGGVGRQIHDFTPNEGFFWRRGRKFRLPFVNGKLISDPSRRFPRRLSFP